jgi:exosortase/archaeosortase family protein
LPDLSYEALLKAEAQAQLQRRRPLWIAVIFLFVFCVLALLWDSAGGTAFERLIIHDLTVRPAAWVIGQVWPEQNVVAQGHRLLSPLGRLNILVGCDGLETLFLLVAAFVAYPFTWRARLTGLALGTALIFCVNQARIVLLWQAWLSDRSLFALLHGILLPAAMIVCCLAFFIAFLVRHDKA